MFFRHNSCPLADGVSQKDRKGMFPQHGIAPDAHVAIDKDVAHMHSKNLHWQVHFTDVPGHLSGHMDSFQTDLELRDHQRTPRCEQCCRPLS